MLPGVVGFRFHYGLLPHLLSIPILNGLNKCHKSIKQQANLNIIKLFDTISVHIGLSATVA